jgi:hypothetical protein
MKVIINRLPSSLTGCVVSLVLSLGSLVSAEQVQRACRDDVCFLVSEKVADIPLTLRGISTFRYWGFRVYSGALYVPTSAAVDSIVDGEIHKKLVLRYHRSLSVEQFIEKSQEVLEQNPKFSKIELEPSLSKINSLYVPVQQGDSYSISYNPVDATMRLYYNDSWLGQIVDRKFARAYFGIWLSDYSVARDFTYELLGKEES